jgi:hypothetical protein
MDKSSSHNPTGSLQVNGPLSPPLTPALNGNSNNAMGIMDGTSNSYLSARPRPLSPDSSVSSSSDFSPSRRPASTFTAPSSTSSQPTISSPDLTREDSRPLPTYRPDAHDHTKHHHHHTTPQPSTRPKPRTYTDGRQDAAFPRLSKPVELLRSSYDVVVIGSGYGGGVAASRMARTGQSVCLLERGREKWPGEYPAGAVDAVKELHYSGTLSPGWMKGTAVEGGDPTGLFHLVMGRGQSAVVGNGEFYLTCLHLCGDG